jgi:hypothetical protein
MPLRRVLCGCMPLTSCPPERSPTAHWAKRAYTHYHHLSILTIKISINFA